MSGRYKEWAFLREAVGEMDEKTLPYLLWRRATESPHDIAFSFPEERQEYSWLKVWQETWHAAQGLLKVGIQKGDRVAILMPGRMEWIISMLAAACTGAVIVPFNSYSAKDELRALLADARPAVLIMATIGHRQPYATILSELMEEHRKLGRGAAWIPKHIFIVDEPNNVFAPFRPYAELLARSGPEEEKQLIDRCRSIRSEDPLVLLYTSGTLGVPKGVLRTTASFLVSSDNDRAAGKRRGADIFRRWTDRVSSRFSVMTLLPLYHLGGFATIITNLKVCNIRIVMLSRFHPITALTVLSEGKYRFLVGTPYMIQRMLNCGEREKFDLSSVLGVIFTSAAVNNDVLQRVTRDLNLIFFMVSYGSSEAGAVSNGICLLERRGNKLLRLMIRLLKQAKFLSGSISPGEFENSAHSLAGKVDRGVEVRIVHPETGEELPALEQGEIQIRSHRVMKYCDEESNRASLTADRWFRSGDLGFLNGNRHLTITGRMKRMVSRGGEKISPIEIERMLLLHADVEDACVVGVPDDLYGEQLCAFIVPRPGRHPTSGQLNESLKPHLSAFKLPKYYIHVPELPMSPTGKVAIAKLERLALESVGELKEYA